ncbi:MAG TPA: alpha/beta fold hydrolase [Thermoanaerobaculia bacterium]|nr:alpha/beta fold hydrolase [Thermoanaerobaculia bacterium]
MNPRALRSIDLHSDAGRIEGLYRDIETPVAVAVICHPHPLFGGTFHNKVVFRAARGLERADVATIRFNFRGAGASQGKHDAGVGEERDFDAALNWIVARHPGLPVFVGGFSFGSWVSTRAGCSRAIVDAMFLIGAPINKYDLGYLRNCDKPLLLIQGSEDEHGDAEKLGVLAAACKEAELIVVAGADHFFKDQVEVVEETIMDWANRIVAERRIEN